MLNWPYVILDIFEKNKLEKSYSLSGAFSLDTSVFTRLLEAITITCYYTLFQNEAAEEVKKEEKKKLALLQDQDLSQYAIKGSEQDWGTALAAGKQGLVSVKRSVLYHRGHAGDKITQSIY